VSNDIVQFLSDPHALLCDGPVGQQLSLAIEALGAFPQTFEDAPARAHVESTPIESTANLAPRRLAASGSNLAFSIAVIELQRETVARAASIPKPIVKAAVTSNA
jgi:hypothetical protein